MPPKPRKITSLYSKKEAEIANMDEQKEKNGEDDAEKEEETNLKKNKKLKEKKLTTESADGTEEGGEGLEKEPDVDKAKAVKRERSLVKTKNNDTSVKQMPQNPFDFIWDTNNLMPMKDGDRELTNLSRNKSNLGGKIAKLDEKEKSLTNYNVNLNDLIDTNSVFSSAGQTAPSETNGEKALIKENNNKPKSEKKKKSKNSTEKKSKTKTKSNATTSNDTNQDENLTSEFLASQQTNSTTGLVKKHDLALNLAQINTPDVSIV